MLTRIDHPSDGAARPLLIAHGLFGSARNWGVIAKRLSDRGPVVAVDMRNHGDSPWTDSHGYDDLAADLAEVIEAMGAPMDVLGHSMGGKAAMVLALMQPSLLGKLVVADIAPMAYGHSQMQYIDAMRAVDLSGIERRSDGEALLAPHVADKGLRAFFLQSLDAAQKRWKLNLDVLAADMDRITGWPDTPGTFDGPALFLTGADSDYVPRSARDQVRAQFPDARFASIPGAGHWLHAEKPRDFEAAVRVFLDL
ncbi:alpha/beta fold hydrolase [Anianabacter salinae]|uniref:alpha/beta fold hydrolase n=1 Tax=Anianabacter salinae TaxID=2851023 RepID=UPI00225DE18B|nr:alpha/beta fold hydrolase [Anianabacter salinae]MBV0911335.1 alpha/beta fold hydrolase [Anianabacter salinae]